MVRGAQHLRTKLWSGKLVLSKHNFNKANSCFMFLGKIWLTLPALHSQLRGFLFPFVLCLVWFGFFC